MIVRPVATPLEGEHLAAVHPVMRPEVEAGWHRRLNLHTGRSLSDLALTVEQQGRAGRLAAMGQLLSSGVVRGLEVGLEVERVRDPNGGESDRHFLHIAAGAGLCASGEDVAVPRARRVAVRDVEVWAPAALEFTGEPPTDGDETPPSDGPSRARRLWPPVCAFALVFSAYDLVIRHKAPTPLAFFVGAIVALFALTILSAPRRP